MPKISVVIPAYNAMAYLPEAVESALNQTFTDLEVIIINDGSSDHTDDWVLRQSDPRLILISQENAGKSAARNAGIARATGQYVAFLDADDYWEPTKLEKQIKYFEDNPGVGLVYTWAAIADENCQPTGRVMRPNAKGNVWKELVQDNILTCGSTPLVSKDCFEKAGLFSPDLPIAQDWDMWIRIAVHYFFAVVKEPLVRYRRHDQNTSRNLEAMANSYKLIVERAFDAAPAELQPLKNKTYAMTYLCLSWKYLQNENDYQTALKFKKEALDHNSKLIFTKEYWRLNIALFLMQSIGPDRYEKFLHWLYIIRRQIVPLKISD